MVDLKEEFEKVEGEFLKFERLQNPLSSRPDLHAFMLLDKLVPGNKDMIAGAVHDEFYLGIDCTDLALVATVENVVELHRCGVRYDSEYDCLAMFA